MLTSAIEPQAPRTVRRPPAAAATGNWIAVASAEHALRGRDAESGFMQVCHGKRAPLARIKPGDRVAYYAPAATLGGSIPLRQFVSIGVVQPGEPFAFDMGGGFVPWRRGVLYVPARAARIEPLLDEFEFIQDRARWGYMFRLGLFAVSEHDMRLIARAMHAAPAALRFA